MGFVGALRQAWRRFVQGLLHPDDELTRAERFMRFMYQLSRHGGRQLISDRAPQMAAALAYRTIFSIIPVLVLSLVVVKTMVGEQGIQHGLEQLLDYLGLNEIPPPDPAAAQGAGDALVQDPEFITTQVQGFVERAMTRVEGIRYGAITIVGVALFVYAAFSLLYQIEQSFNYVCRAASGRSIAARITNYWTLLTLGAVGLFASLGVQEGYRQLIEELPSWARWATTPIQFATRLGITWLVLLFAYVRVPNTRMGLRHAAVGALIASILWELSKGVLSLFIVGIMEKNAAVYGTLALLPVSMFWIYITWLIVLFGLEVTSALQTLNRSEIAGGAQARGPTVIDVGSSVAIAHGVARAFAEGHGAEVGDLARRAGMDRHGAKLVLERLVRRGIVHEIAGESSGEDPVETYALARPPSSIRLSEIVAAVREQGDEDEDSGERAASILTRLRGIETRALGEWTLASLDDDAPEEPDGSDDA